jgi:hypothetical protein
MRSSGSVPPGSQYNLVATDPVFVSVVLADSTRPNLLPAPSNISSGLVSTMSFVRGQGKDSPFPPSANSIFQLENHFSFYCDYDQGTCTFISQGLSAVTSDNMWAINVKFVGSFDALYPCEGSCKTSDVSELQQTITITSTTPLPPSPPPAPATVAATLTLDPSATPFVAAGGMFITGVSPDGSTPQTVRLLPGNTATISTVGGTFTLDPTGYSPQRVTLFCPTTDCAGYCPPSAGSGQTPCNASWSLLTIDGQWKVSATCSGFVVSNGSCSGWTQTGGFTATITPVGTGAVGTHHAGLAHHTGPTVVSHSRQTPWGTHRLGTLLH